MPPKRRRGGGGSGGRGRSPPKKRSAAAASGGAESDGDAADPSVDAAALRETLRPPGVPPKLASSVAALLHQLELCAASASRRSAALTGLAEGRSCAGAAAVEGDPPPSSLSSSATDGADDPDANLLLAGTDAIQRLIAALRRRSGGSGDGGSAGETKQDDDDDGEGDVATTEKKKRSLAVVLALTSRAVLSVLLADRSALERCAGSGPVPSYSLPTPGGTPSSAAVVVQHARSAAARATVAATLGGALALETLVACGPPPVASHDGGVFEGECEVEGEGEDEDEDEGEGDDDELRNVAETALVRRALWSGLVALESGVHFQRRGPGGTDAAHSSPVSGVAVLPVSVTALSYHSGKKLHEYSAGKDAKEAALRAAAYGCDTIGFSSAGAGDQDSEALRASAEDAALALACRVAEGAAYPAEEEGIEDAEGSLPVAAAMLLSAVSAAAAPGEFPPSGRSPSSAGAVGARVLSEDAAPAPPPPRRAARSSRSSRRSISDLASASAATAATAASSSSPAAPSAAQSVSATTSRRNQAMVGLLLHPSGAVDGETASKNGAPVGGGRALPPRRWGPAAFVWLAGGQKRVLRAALGLLKDDNDEDRDGWASVMKLPSAPDSENELEKKSGASDSAKSRKSKGTSSSSSSPPVHKKRGRRSTGGVSGGSKPSAGAAESSPSPTDTAEPPARRPSGDVALLAFASRLVDVVAEAGANCGIRSPTGGLEAYVAAVLGPPSSPDEEDAVAAPSIKVVSSSSRPSRPTRGRRTRAAAAAAAVPVPVAAGLSQATTSVAGSRPDVGPLAAELMRALVERHRLCLLHLSSSEGGGSTCGQGLIFLCDAAPPSSQSGGAGAALAASLYLPSLHETLGRLADAASGSCGADIGLGGAGLGGDLDAAGDARRRLLALGAALALGRGCCVRAGAAVGGGESTNTDDDNEPMEDDSSVEGGDSDGAAWIVDARLTSFALERLGDCLGGLAYWHSDSGVGTTCIGSGRNSACVQSDDDDDDNRHGSKKHAPHVVSLGKGKLGKDLVTKYELHDPLRPDARRPPFGGAFPALAPGAAASPPSSSSALVTRSGGSVSILERAHLPHTRVRGERNRARDGECLALFLRAALESDGEDGDDGGDDGVGDGDAAGRSPARLLATVARIARFCYAQDSHPLGPEGAEGASGVAMTFARCSVASDALDALKTALLLKPPGDTTKDTAPDATALHASLRSRGLSTELVSDVVRLGYLVDRGLVQPRVRAALAGSGEGKSGGGGDESSKDQSLAVLVTAALGRGNEFEPWERHLWTSHIKLCLTVGRGDPAFVRRHRRGHVLGDAKNRLAVLRDVAERCRDGGDEDAASGGWPLYLPPPLHALVSSSLTREPYPRTSKEAAPELYVANGFVTSIAGALANLDVVAEYHPRRPAAESGKSGDGSSSSSRARRRRVTHVVSDEAAPLSLRDGRLFLLAASRLPRKDLSRVLNNLIDTMHTATVSSALSKTKILSAVSSSSDAHGIRSSAAARKAEFVARVVTVCAAVVDMACAGRGLAETLRLELGNDEYHLPSFLEVEEEDDGLADDDADGVTDGADADPDFRCGEWYRRERSFMGLYSDWESPSVPAEGTTVSDLDHADPPFSKSHATKLRRSLEAIFDMGFESAKSDRCHLLFAAWNALGRSEPWDVGRTATPWTGPSSASALKSYGYARRMLELREDACHVYRRVGNDPGAVPDTLLSRLTSRKDDSSSGGGGGRSVGRRPVAAHRRAAQASETLDGCVDAAVALAYDVLGEIETKSEGSASSAFFAMSEALVAYLSLLIALHTKANGGDFMSVYLKGDKPPSRGGGGSGGRRRKNSSLSAESMEDDDNNNDDDDEDEENVVLSDDSSDGVLDGGYPGYSGSRSGRGSNNNNNNSNNDDDDDDDDVDAEDAEDARVEALSRLRDACSDLGAAPFRPDWLNGTCRLRDGVTDAAAAEAAERALTVLRRLGEAASARRAEAVRAAVLVGDVDESTKEGGCGAAAALRVASALRDVDVDVDADDLDPQRSPESLVAALCGPDGGVDASSLGLALSGGGGPECRNAPAVRESWCPASAQRIRGKLQERLSSGSGECGGLGGGGPLEGCDPGPAEMRAADEWELLLSEALVGCAVDADVTTFAQGDDSPPADPERRRVLRERFGEAHRWRRLLRGCVHAMCPAAALLRFGLNGGRGRKSHPLAKKDSASGGAAPTSALAASSSAASPPSAAEAGGNTMPLRPSSPVPDHVRAPILARMGMTRTELSGAVIEAVAFLARTSVEAGRDDDDDGGGAGDEDAAEACIKRTCRAAACHLLGNSDHFVHVEAVYALGGAFSAVLETCRLVEGAAGSGKAERDERAHAARVIFDRLILAAGSRTEVSSETNGAGAGAGASSSSGEDSTGYIRPLAFLGFPNLLRIDVLAETAVDQTRFLARRISPRVKDEGDADAAGWNSLTTARDRAIEALVHVLTRRGPAAAERRTRARAARLLVGVLDLERERVRANPSDALGRREAVVLACVLRRLNGASAVEIANLTEDIALPSSSSSSAAAAAASAASRANEPNEKWSDDADTEFSRGLCSVVTRCAGIMSPLPAARGTDEERACRAVLDGLLEHLRLRPLPDHVVDLLALLAARFDLLKDVGVAVVELAMPPRREEGGRGNGKGAGEAAEGEVNLAYLPPLERFLGFAHDLHQRFHDEGGGGATRSPRLRHAAAAASASRERQNQSSTTTTATTAMTTSAGGGRPNDDSTHYVTESGDRVRRTCTFIETGGDFQEQHWYNCYTCGLLWDKGCCSLCVLVCHKGHDVGYSRKSSFFCDCGAEVATAGEQNRVACRCLSPLSNREMALVYDKETGGGKGTVGGGRAKKGGAIQKETEGASNGVDSSSSSFSSSSDKEFGLLTTRQRAVDVAAQSFPSQAKQSLRTLMIDAKASRWTETLFYLFNRCFETWTETKGKSSASSSGLLSSLPSSLSSPSHHGDDDNVDASSASNAKDDIASGTPPDMKNRSGKVLELAPFAGRRGGMVPLRAAKASAINAKLSIDSATDRLKRSILGKNDLRRSVVAADSRGRLVIAEPSSLVFCGALPVVNVRHAESDRLESPLDRAGLCVRGTSRMKLSVVGLEVCPTNDRHVVAWGTSEVCVAVLNEDCDKVVRRIAFAELLETHECETEYLLKCEWLPRSDTMVVVTCSAFVKVFDIRRATGGSGGTSGSSAGSTADLDYSCRSSTCYTLAYEDVLIRSGAMFVKGARGTSAESGGTAGGISSSSPEALEEESSYTVRMALLFDSGRLHFSDLSIDHGELEDQGESYIECGDGVPFPTVGVRRYSGASPGSPGSTTSSFGEGSSVAYLEQSGLLLYKCISSCLVALVVGGDGTITGSFEFLPHNLDGHAVSGPYTNWTELGTAKRDNKVYYRVACVGKSTRTNQPKVLLIEFNDEQSVHVKELTWAARSSMGLGLSLNTSFEGLAAFSGPFLTGSNAKRGCVGSDGVFHERVYLTALTSNGSMLFFGEDCDNSEPPKRQGESALPACPDEVHSGAFTRCAADDGKGASGDDSKPSFPLTVFETLVNVSTRSELTFGGDGAGSEPDAIKRKLSISVNGEFFISPGVSGCTLTAKLRDGTGAAKRGKADKDKSSASAVGAGRRGIKKNNEDTTASCPENLVIVAVRVLLGSTTTDYLPKSVTVMGRPIKLTQGVKRWYDIPLTDEEIMLGVRSNYVSIGIGPADMSNNPLVDAVEVYALPRDDMPYLCPRYSSPGTNNSVQPKQKGRSEIVVTDQHFRKSLDHSLLSLLHVSKILGEGILPTNENRKTLQRLVQVTAVNTNPNTGSRGDVRKHVLELLKGVEQDSQVLVDEGTLFGVAEAVRDIKSILSGRKCAFASPPSSNQDEVMQDASANVQKPRKDVSAASLADLLVTMKRCLELALSVATDRPGNYTAALEKMAREGIAAESIAVVSKEVLVLYSNPSFPVSSTDFAPCAANLAKLALVEKAIESLQQSSGKSLVTCGNFDLVSSLLCADDAMATKEVSTAIMELLSSGGSQSEPKKDTSQDKQPEATAPPIAYQCDSCGVFPITDLRYTLEGGHDIDLCQKCYDAGSEFARGCRLDPGTALSIRGKKVRLGSSQTHMTCSQLWQMRRVSIAIAIIEQVEQAKRAAKESSQPSTGEDAKLDTSAFEGIDDDERDLQRALQMSLETQHDVAMDDAPSAPQLQEPINLLQQNELISELFTVLLDLAMTALSAVGSPTLQHPVHLLDLLLFFAWKLDKDGQLDRGTTIAAKLCERMRIVIEALVEERSLSSDSSSRLRSSLVMILRTLVSLSMQQHSIAEGVHNAEGGNGIDDDSAVVVDERNKDRNDKTDPRFVCDTHGVPAVRRRCSKGENKDRRFYVCGMDRKKRCNYFKWADADTSDQPGGASGKQCTSEAASKVIQSELWKLFCGGHPPLQSQLCDYMQTCFERSESNTPSPQKDVCRESGESRPSSLSGSFQNEQTRSKDWFDGASLSRARLTGHAGTTFAKSSEAKGTSDSDSSGTLSTGINNSSDTAIVQAALNLLSLTASKSIKGKGAASRKSVDSLNNVSHWYELLCEIISTSSSANLRSLSKKVLKRLCGRAGYHRVRDHFVFGFQFRTLVSHASPILQAALIVRERARQCGPNWRGPYLDWSSLAAGDFIGVGELISEDNYSSQDCERIERALEELKEVAKKSLANWRHFCGLDSLPRSRNIGGFLTEAKNGDNVGNRSPITSLFWVACSLQGGPLQVQAFQLIEAALSVPAADKSVPDESCGGVLSTDVGTDLEGSVGKPGDYLFKTESNSPALFASKNGLSIGDIYAFAVQFVLRGKTLKLRTVSSKVCQALFRSISSPDDLNTLFLKLTGEPFVELGSLGCDALEFLELVKLLVIEFGPTGSMNLGSVQSALVSCFTAQVSTMNRLFYSEDMGVMEVEADGVVKKKVFDLAHCIHCHRLRPDAPHSSESAAPSMVASAPTSSTTRSARSADGPGRVPTSAGVTASASSSGDTPWLPEQVRPFAKGRLESSTEKAVSAEFTSYAQLKYRVVISDVYLSVSDPRGRLVKTIGVYFTPRQVSDVSELKSADYAHIWQQCGKISLSRGGMRASLSLSTPVAAANLKFVYEEFYEKAGGSRASSSDGTGGSVLMLHCPRCTRVVNNAHGVCGHCGEVAFQCRKCRHINYDRLDAFLCVECGYCASGGFSYELTAGIASNAVAIVDDEGLERGSKLLRIASRRQGDMRSGLKKKLMIAASGKKKRSRCEDFDNLEGLNNYSPPLKRAMLGELPKSSSRGSGDGGGGGGESPSKRRSSGTAGASSSSRRSDPGGRMSAANKARSLLSLARQLRSDTGADLDRTSRGDMLVRQALLNAGGSGLEIFDEAESDMFGLNAASDAGALGLDMPDPLSRLVANIQARVRSSSGGDDGRPSGGGSSGGAGGGSGGDGDGTGGSGSSRRSEAPQVLLDECEKMHHQMREAERECTELLRRINAWKRLNSDVLSDYGPLFPEAGMIQFNPTCCMACCGGMLSHILSLVMACFRASMKDCEYAISKELICALFDEQFNRLPDINEAKRSAMRYLATNSELGAKLVLDELRTRLKATRDVVSAEILGSLVQEDFSMSEQYVSLAVSMLDEGMM